MGAVVLQVVGTLLLLDVIVQCGFARVLIAFFERRPRLRARAYPRHSQAGCFTAQTTDGLTLRGSVIRTSGNQADGVIVYCHEFGGDRWSYQGHCSRQILETHDLVTFDFRNHGQSEAEANYQPTHWLTTRELADVQAVIDWVQSRPEWAGRPLMLMGVSRGANAALAAAATRSVAGVVAVGAFSTLDLAFHHLLDGIRRYAPIFFKVRFPHWHIRSTLMLAVRWSGLRQGVSFIGLERMIRRLEPDKMLFIAGSDDSHIPVAFQTELADRVPGAEFWTVPG
ncbi:MAG TPA: alpha/beta hydrolase, partial [Caulifigura sp.]|nr:alpha/beta hydrolase [Caulifigura sp.]